MGVKSACGEEIIAVAQAVNKNRSSTSYGCFTREDEKVKTEFAYIVSESELRKLGYPHKMKHTSLISETCSKNFLQHDFQT
jgi:hypothetical protein